MKIIFMIPIICFNISILIFFILHYGEFAQKGLNGIGIVGLFFYTLYSAATISQFKNDIPAKSKPDLAKKGIIYFIFITVFTPVHFFALYIPAKTIYNFLLSQLGKDITSAIGGAMYAIILIILSAVLWSVNNWIAPEKK